jgi:PhnB protein
LQENSGTEIIMNLDSYLHFNGNCGEAFKFYEKVLGGKIEGSMTYGQSPAAAQSAPDMRDKVIHIRMKVGDRILMGSDAPADRYQPPQGFSVSLGVKDVTESERLYKAMSEGAKIIMPLQKTFWSASFAMFVDRFGIPWMINCQQPM